MLFSLCNDHKYCVCHRHEYVTPNIQRNKCATGSVVEGDNVQVLLLSNKQMNKFSVPFRAECYSFSGGNKKKRHVH